MNRTPDVYDLLPLALELSMSHDQRRKREEMKEKKEKAENAISLRETRNLMNKLKTGAINAFFIKHWWLDRLIIFIPLKPYKPYKGLQGFIVYFHKHARIDSAKLENASKLRRFELFGEIMEVSEEKFDRKFFLKAKEKQGIKVSDAFRRKILCSYRLYKMLERQKGKIYDFLKTEFSESWERM